MSILVQQGLMSTTNVNVSVEHSNSPTREDGALFTKRPIQCLSCGSCDKPLKGVSPIPSGTFSQWKKLPARDPMDRLAKSGTGFSKMLSSIKNPQNMEGSGQGYTEVTEET